MSAPLSLVTVVGPTAVGKTPLAIALARQFDGEIVNADSRQVYAGMDIGTAKPTVDELRAARHHLVDIRTLDAPISLGEYLPMARASIADIASRGKLPILCGGTGQYVWALLEGWQVPQVPPDADLRAELERRASADGMAALYRELQQLDPKRAESIGPYNTRRIIRALEIHQAYAGPISATDKSTEPPYRALVIGLTADRTALYDRIDTRFDTMMDAGLMDEVSRLVAAGYGSGKGPLSSVGYAQLAGHLAGEMTLADAIARAKTQTHRLVRRQYAWFKPTDPRIAWLDATGGLPIEAATSLVREFMASPTPCGTIASDSPQANSGTESQ